jgi:hypothetical protein
VGGVRQNPTLPTLPLLEFFLLIQEQYRRNFLSEHLFRVHRSGTSFRPSMTPLAMRVGDLDETCGPLVPEQEIYYIRYGFFKR